MNKYYIDKNKDSNDNNNVHKEDCIHMPKPPDALFLGIYSNCAAAVLHAQKQFPNATGCWDCARKCYIR